MLGCWAGVTVVTEGASAALALDPNTSSLPPQAVIKVMAHSGIIHLSRMESFFNIFIVCRPGYDF
jgi:hypothetical protein